MKKIILTFTAFTMLVMVSCGEKKTETKKDESTKDKGAAPGAAVEEFTYSYDSTTTKVKWIAYKFTGKTPVEGTFEKVSVSNNNPGSTPAEALNNAWISIPVSSLQTGDEEKNKNIIEHFFLKMTATTEITGSVREINETNAIITLKMNDMEGDVSLECKWEGEKLTASGTLSLENFMAQSAIDVLNKKCKKNHTGEDGITKVWPEVTIMVETTLKKESVQ